MIDMDKKNYYINRIINYGINLLNSNNNKSKLNYIQLIDFESDSE